MGKENLMRKIIIFVGLLGLFFLSTPGCSRKSDSGTTNQRYLTIKGSDTMVHLASSWAEAYMELEGKPDVSVTGGGSGTGIAALLNGTTDICIASRNIKAGEIELAGSKGINPLEIAVARDGIVVIIHRDNPVKALTVEQIGKIYTGAYTNWQQVGGPDADILVLSRESSSGTYVFFQERVLSKKDYTASARLMPATSAIVRSVAEDKWTIGYVGLGYAIEAGEKVKMLLVKDKTDSPEVLPSVMTVRSTEYPIARALYIYTNGEPAGAVKEFVEFALGDQGQQIVTETGYVPVR
jgi:phosphate transport system substrate-binding protein